MSVSACQRFALQLILLLLIAPGSWAACPEKSMFEPSCDDASVFYLNKLFGVYDRDEAEFASGSIFSNLIVTLNKFLLNFGLLFIVYIILVGLIRTAGGGQFLGERGSMWTPIRFLIGLLLLAPQPGTDYVRIQAYTMGVIQAGIGAADSLWIKVNELLPDVSVYDEGGERSRTEVLEEVQATAKSVFQGLVCRYIFNYNKPGVFRLQTQDGTLTEQHTIPYDIDGTDPYLVDPGNQFYLDDDVNVDTFSWNGIAPIITQLMVDSQAQSYRWFTVGLNPSASGAGTSELLFGSYRPETDSVGNECGVMKIRADKAQYYAKFINEVKVAARDIVINYMTDVQQEIDAIPILNKTDLQNSGVTLAGCLMKTEGTSETCDNMLPQPQSGDPRDKGWLVTGLYYVGLGSTGLGGTRVGPRPLNDVSISLTGEETDFSELYEDYKRLGENDDVYDALSNRLTTAMMQGETSPGDNPLERIYDVAVQRLWKYSPSRGDLFSFIAPMSWIARGITEGYTKTFKRGGDPFKDSRRAGYSLMSVAVNIMVLIAILSFTGVLVTNSCSGKVSLGNATETTSQYLAMLGFGLASTMFAEGAMFAIFLPMIPLLAWLMAVVGWLVIVIEAMIASPLIGLALMWPEHQHEIFGRAESALMLLINLLIRPSLLLVGFILAMLVCKIAFSLSGLMIAIAANNYHPVVRPESSFGWIPLGFAYGGILMVIASRSFSVTTELADRVLSWIGGNISSYSIGSSREVTAEAKKGTKHGADSATPGRDSLQAGYTAQLRRSQEKGAATPGGGEQK